MPRDPRRPLPAPVRAATRIAARALALVLVLATAGAAGAQDGPAELVAADPYPLRGEPVEIRLTGPGGNPLPGVPVSALYRPNSETAHTEALGPTGPDGVLTWTPADAGVVTLRAGGEGDAPPVAEAQLAVRFGSFPAVGLLVMVVAAVLLFGGAALGFRLLLKPPPHIPAVEPPST